MTSFFAFALRGGSSDQLRGYHGEHLAQPKSSMSRYIWRQSKHGAIYSATGGVHAKSIASDQYYPLRRITFRMLVCSAARTSCQSGSARPMHRLFAEGQGSWAPYFLGEPSSAAFVCHSP